MIGLSAIRAKLAGDGVLLILGAVIVIGLMVFGKGLSLGERKAQAQNDRAFVIVSEKTEKAQSSLNETVQKIETKGKVRRAQTEKKVADAVAEIQAHEPETDPVLVWASAIDSLRNDAARARDPAPAYSEPV